MGIFSGKGMEAALRNRWADLVRVSARPAARSRGRPRDRALATASLVIGRTVRLEITQQSFSGDCANQNPDPSLFVH
jgi:hypothetical protein